MISPAYSITATERVLPRLALDFTTGVLDPRVTVTRSLDTATRVNSSGLVEVVNANLPRFDFNPVTLAPRGLLIEESRANLILQSAAFDTASWSKVLSLNVDQDAATAPDGTSSADRLRKSATTFQAINQAISFGSTTGTCESVYVKRDNVDYVGFTAGGVCDLTVSLVNGSITRNSGTLANALVTNEGNGWYRISYTISRASGSRPTLYMWPTDVANNSSFVTVSSTASCFVWGGQVEAGAFPTSYIPTTTTSLTRNADAVTMTGANFSDWFNASEGTLVVEASTFKPTTSSSSAVVAEVNDGTLSNRNTMQYQSNLANARTVTAGSIVVNLTQAYVANATDKLAYAFKTNNFAFARNGSIVGSSVSATNPTVDRLTIGSFSANTAPLNGYVKTLRYYSIRLTNAELQAFST